MPKQHLGLYRYYSPLYEEDGCSPFSIHNNPDFDNRGTSQTMPPKEKKRKSESTESTDPAASSKKSKPSESVEDQIANEVVDETLQQEDALAAFIRLTPPGEPIIPNTGPSLSTLNHKPPIDETNPPSETGEPTVPKNPDLMDVDKKEEEEKKEVNGKKEESEKKGKKKRKEVTHGAEVANEIKQWGSEKLQKVASVLQGEEEVNPYNHAKLLRVWKRDQYKFSDGWKQYDETRWVSTTADRMLIVIAETYARMFRKGDAKTGRDGIRKKADQILKWWEKLEKGHAPIVKVDRNKKLVFTNAVVELERDEASGRYHRVIVRDGRLDDPDEMFDYGYKPWDPVNDPMHRKVLEFVTRVIPNEAERTWLLRMMSQGLFGHRLVQLFIIWVGGGSDGKSTFCDLLGCTFGRFHRELMTQHLLTKPKSDYDSHLAGLRDGRLVVFREFDADDILIPKKVKQLSGDPIKAREAFRKMQEAFQLHCLSLAITNNIPYIPEMNHSTERRVNVMETKVRFTNDPTLVDEANHVYLADTEMINHLKDYREGMMSWLIHLLTQTVNDPGLLNDTHKPATVVERTREYWDSIDPQRLFQKEHWEFDPKGEANQADLNAHVDAFILERKEWCKRTKFDRKAVKKYLCSAAMREKGVMWRESHIFRGYAGAGKGFIGIKLKFPIIRTKRQTREYKSSEIVSSDDESDKSDDE
ncbi:hypothetical protein HK097_005037 [Rhizophlyctis rosea]|uniref:SF3 helicase domain-containing protein n=1 Tax=Rhizophlyctis rosea TaxID=64517 RepID=A0AAD5S0P6_9FUNG|nr:hypothetical protein HK097_005037 [Rhizophlyctis rosea]